MSGGPDANAGAATTGSSEETSSGTSTGVDTHDAESSTAEDEADGSSGAALQFTVTVEHGYGGGLFEPGDTVHVWAALDPATQQVVQWTGDAVTVDDAGEWHTQFVMPASDVELSAQLQPVDFAFSTKKFSGRDRGKTLRWFAPPQPRGMLLLFHGTGGSGAFVEKAEAGYIARLAAGRGLVVASLDAEEVDAGDLDGNGNLRWEVALSSDNVDFANVERAVAELHELADLPKNAPVFAVGMSNGGAFSIALGASGLLAGAAAYCADGTQASANATATPTAWFLCGNDPNEQVDNASAEARHAMLLERGIPSEIHVHPSSPLYPERFARVDGIDIAESIGITEELVAAGVVNEAGVFTVTGAELVALAQAEPEAFELLLGSAAQGGVLDQIQIMMAEHKLYDDYAVRTLDFLLAQVEG